MKLRKKPIGTADCKAAGRRSRRGLAVAELAVCLPIVVLLVVATIEACSAIFLKHSLTVAAYEGVRVALEQGATAASVQSKCNEILIDRRVKDATITVAPSDIASLDAGEYLDVTITAPCSSNAIVPVTFYRGRNMSATASMMNEY